MRIFLSLLFFVLLLPSLTYAFEKGPYLQATTRDATLLVWQTKDAGRAQVDLRGPGVERTLTAPAADPEGMVRLALDGLKPGQTYEYSVQQGEQRAGGTLTTQVAEGRPFDFVVFGDNRSDHRAHAAVIQGIIDLEPDFLVSTGDLVGHGGDEDDWVKFFEIERPLLANVPLYPVLGNHEIYGNGHTLFERYFVLPNNERYYAFTRGNIRFIAIDGELHIGPGHGPDPKQREWLMGEIRTAAANPKIDHIVGYIHRGPFSSHPVRSGNTALRELLPELHAAGMTLMLSGHDHFYERGLSKFGMPYLVIGGGGAPLYQTIGPGDHGEYIALVSRSVHSFVRFRSNGGVLSGCAIDLSGASFDCFEFPPRRRKPRREPEITTP